MSKEKNQQKLLSPKNRRDLVDTWVRIYEDGYLEIEEDHIDLGGRSSKYMMLSPQQVEEVFLFWSNYKEGWKKNVQDQMGSTEGSM